MDADEIFNRIGFNLDSAIQDLKNSFVNLNNDKYCKKLLDKMIEVLNTKGIALTLFL